MNPNTITTNPTPYPNTKTQKTGLKRNPIDKFYTNPATVNICMTHIKTHIDIGPEDTVIEPSAGNGAFIPSLCSLSNKTYFFDIEPNHPQITQQDYLLFDPTLLARLSNDNRIHIIGNPPFGRQSSTAIKFIKKSSEFCNSISFILPKSFKKDSMKRAFPAEFHLVCEVDLPSNSFLVDNTDYSVDTVFQIWIKKPEKRDAIQKLIPSHFRFVAKTENPDISFRRVGVYAGKIDKDIDKSPQSHYFIKFENEQIDEIVDKLSSIKFEHNNTVGPRSISKQELICEFNRLLSPVFSINC